MKSNHKDGLLQVAVIVTKIISIAVSVQNSIALCNYFKMWLESTSFIFLFNSGWVNSPIFQVHCLKVTKSNQFCYFYKCFSKYFCENFITFYEPTKHQFKRKHTSPYISLHQSVLYLHQARFSEKDACSQPTHRVIHFKSRLDCQIRFTE